MTHLDSTIYATTNNSNAEWKKEANATIDLLVLRGKEFTSEDVLRILADRGVSTHDNRALGGLFMGRSRKGILEFSRYERATRSTRHRAPIAVWQPVCETLEMAD